MKKNSGNVGNPGNVGGGRPIVVRVDLTEESSNGNVNTSKKSSKISLAGVVARYQRNSDIGGGSASEVVTLSSDDDPVVCLSDTSVSDIGISNVPIILSNNQNQNQNQNQKNLDDNDYNYGIKNMTATT